MPIVQANLSVSSECPFMIAGITTVITPVWQAESDDKESDKTPRLPEGHGLDAFNDLIGENTYDLLQAEGFSGARGKTVVLRVPPSEITPVRRFILLGLGKPKDLSKDALRTAYEKAFKLAASWDAPLRHVAASMPKPYERFGGGLFNEEDTKTTVTIEEIATAVASAVHSSTYVSGESKKPGKGLERVILVSEHASAVESVLPFVLALNEGRTFAKDLVNMPANIKRTSSMAAAAKAVADGSNGSITLDIIDDVAWIEKEMPCFFEVARGSVKSDPPKFIHLTYKGANPTRKVALVGKSVIFDTGGYQVKPGNYMVTMKGDMAGAASVMGAAKALSMMKVEHLEAHFYFAATPNMIDDFAMIPDSIVNTSCGKKVEIRHTDAEGRLTLIDAVTKAAEVKPEAIVTVATLTGAAKMSVGMTICLMANNTAWRDKVEAAANESGDPVQVADVRPDDFENIKSKLDGADIRNTNKGSSRGYQTAAAFVMSGAPEGMPVIHLDIAGADMHDDETATGYSVGTLIHFLKNL